MDSAIAVSTDIFGDVGCRAEMIMFPGVARAQIFVGTPYTAAKVLPPVSSLLQEIETPFSVIDRGHFRLFVD
jgi:hypothetical protein